MKAASPIGILGVKLSIAGGAKKSAVREASDRRTVAPTLRVASMAVGGRG